MVEQDRFEGRINSQLRRASWHLGLVIMMVGIMAVFALIIMMKVVAIAKS